MGFVLLGARVLLAIVFAVAGLAKLADRAGSRQALIDFGVPDLLATPAGVLLPLAELAVAVALIPTATSWWAAIGALVLLLLFIAGISFNLAHGRTPDCHCFGQLHSAPAGWPTLLRNALLAAVAGFVIGFGQTNASQNTLNWPDALAVVQRSEPFVVVIAVVLMMVEGWVLLQVLRQQGRLLLRIEALETRLTGKSAAANSALAEAGLPRGTQAPTFRLPNLYGETLTLDSLRASGKQILLIFSDPHCGPCVALMPEIGRWQRDYASKLTLAIISRGAPEDNRGKATEHAITHVLLQNDREVDELYHAAGTPSAVLVSPDGTIDSSLAQGAEEIRALVAGAVGLPVLRSVPVAAQTVTTSRS